MKQPNDAGSAKNGDGWMLYPRPTEVQRQVIHDWRMQLRRLERPNQPILEPLYIDLHDNPDSAPAAIQLGYRLGVNRLVEYLQTRREIGVNHVAINLRFDRADTEDTMRQLAESVLPEFNSCFSASTRLS